jgi:hypothetical protein
MRLQAGTQREKAGYSARVLAPNQNLENNPMQSSLVSGIDTLSDPRTHFDTSGQSTTLLHYREICNTKPWSETHSLAVLLSIRRPG